MSSLSSLLVDRPRESVLRLTLNRPEQLNAFTYEMTRGITAALQDATADPGCRAVVLTGQGRGFCSGVDLKGSGVDEWLDGRDPIEARIEWAEHITDVLMAVRRCSRPVIAAVNGVAAGGGFSLSLLADMRIGGSSAAFADGYIRNGLSGCELGLSFLLPRLIGSGRAMELMLTGRKVEAAEAERIGLVNRVVPDDELQDAALELAGQIAAHPAFAVTMTKQVATANQDATGLDTAMLLEMRTQMLAVHTGDSREARAAFLDRRAPEYAGYRTR